MDGAEHRVHPKNADRRFRRLGAVVCASVGHRKSPESLRRSDGRSLKATTRLAGARHRLKGPALLWLLGALSIGACADDFTVVDGGGANDASPRDTGAADSDRPDGRRDGGGLDACTPTGPTCDQCEPPLLLASVQSFQGTCGGQILRFGLPADGPVCVCPPLALDDPLPLGIAFRPPEGGADGAVIVAFSTKITRIPDREWRIDALEAPFDLFLAQPNGPTDVFVATGNSGGGPGRISYVLEGDELKEAPFMSGHGSATGFTQSSNSPGEMRVSAFGFTARDYALPGGAFERTYIDNLGHGSIYSYFYDGLHRTAVAVLAGAQPSDRGIVVSTSEQALPATPVSSIRCREESLQGCRYVSAVVSPRSERHVFASCDADNDARLVRIDRDTRECEELVQVSFRDDEHIRIQRLALALDSYWPAAE